MLLTLLPTTHILHATHTHTVSYIEMRNSKRNQSETSSVQKIYTPALHEVAKQMRTSKSGGWDTEKAFNFTFSNVFNMHVINNPDTAMEWDSIGYHNIHIRIHTNTHHYQRLLLLSLAECIKLDIGFNGIFHFLIYWNETHTHTAQADWSFRTLQLKIIKSGLSAEIGI